MGSHFWSLIAVLGGGFLFFIGTFLLMTSLRGAVYRDPSKAKLTMIMMIVSLALLVIAGLLIFIGLPVLMS